MDEDTGPVDPSRVTAKLDRHIVLLFLALGIVCYLDRTNLSFAALPLSQDLGLSCQVSLDTSLCTLTHRRNAARMHARAHI
jgi:hypothetical protein